MLMICIICAMRNITIITFIYQFKVEPGVCRVMVKTKLQDIFLINNLFSHLSSLYSICFLKRLLNLIIYRLYIYL